MKNSLPPKERTKLPRQTMPILTSDVRRQNFQEVNLGLNVLQAQAEAKRCLECSHPRCVHGCPVGVKIKEFVQLVCAGDYLGAAAKIREDNVLPAITGRVCPQERQCEGQCILGKRHAPLAIGHLERFVADYERAQGKLALPPKAPPSGKRVAIIGSGPAGLSAAGDLMLKGHEVTVFEALHEPGGVLIYGIPEFRLPKEIVRYEIDNLRKMGVTFETNSVIGKTITIDELLGSEGFDAVFIATGAGLPKFLGVPGEHLVGVYSANEFLTRVNLMHANQFPDYDEPIYDCRQKTVAVIGGGNTAIDAVRTAVRLGASRAMLIYRRSEAEMSAREEEIHHAREEGVEVVTLTVPTRFVGDEQGRVRAAICRRMRLGEPDSTGRQSAVPMEGSEFELPLDVVIIALGTGANPLVQSATPNLATDAHGYIYADPQTLLTSKRGVFAGGDVVTGGATVILAMGAGRRAAAEIDKFMRGQESEDQWPALRSGIVLRPAASSG
jgi:glutamate synthase (NADPH/NADH) small chain